jgi:hypothetical protein
MILELKLKYRILSHMANCTVMKLFTFFIAPLMLNISEETEASISDDEFVVNPMDTDSTWDTFETSKSDSVIQMIVNISVIVMDFAQQYKRSYNFSIYFSSAYISLRGTFTYICRHTLLLRNTAPSVGL